MRWKVNKEVKNKIKLLELVKNRIEKGYDCFICNATRSIARRHTELKQADEQIRGYIRKAMSADSPDYRINPIFYTLDDWLLCHQPKSEYRFELKQARLMWIDWMINCYLEDNKE